MGAVGVQAAKATIDRNGGRTKLSVNQLRFKSAIASYYRSLRFKFLVT